MSHVLYRIGNFAGRHPWRVISAWLLVAAAVFMLNSSIGGQPDESFSLPGAESQRAADAIQDRFPQQTLYSSNVVLHSDHGLTDPATKAAVEQAVEKLADGPHVVAVSSPYDPRGPTLSEDGRTGFATVGFTTEKVTMRTTTPPRRPSRISVTRASRSSTTAASATPTCRPAETAS